MIPLTKRAKSDPPAKPLISSMSAPALNARPAPSTTTARTVRVGVDLAHGGGERARGVAADRVQPVGTGELQERDRAVAPDGDLGGVAHAIVRPPLTDSV